MFTLNKLSPLMKKRKRVGRGGSRGGTSGRGHKGQKARSGGGVGVGFEGGQMPLYRRLPKRGFSNVRFKEVTHIINIDGLNVLTESHEEITKELLLKKGVIKAAKGRPFTLKILGRGKLKKPVTIVADSFSAAARKSIEDAGGKALTQKG